MFSSSKRDTNYSTLVEIFIPAKSFHQFALEVFFFLMKTNWGFFITGDRQRRSPTSHLKHLEDSVGSVTQKPKSHQVTMYAVCLLKEHQTSQQRAMSSKLEKSLLRPKKNPLTQPRMLLQTLSSRIFVVGFEQGSKGEEYHEIK